MDTNNINIDVYEYMIAGVGYLIIGVDMLEFWD
jgi:hypothetical protein